MPDADYAVTVYRYGLCEPLDWGGDCDAEMWRMTRLWNQLVAIERDHRAAVDALTADDPAVASLAAELAEATTARAAATTRRKALRKAARARPNSASSATCTRHAARHRDDRCS